MCHKKYMVVSARSRGQSPPCKPKATEADQDAELPEPIDD